MGTWGKHGTSRESVCRLVNYGTGKPFVDLSAGLDRACRKAGITGVMWHTLRHTFASRLLERGVDILMVKELLGHSTAVVTMRYTHTNLDSKVRAVGKLAGDCYNIAKFSVFWICSVFVHFAPVLVTIW
jgi:integrase-like protein